jgi:hypothetical protein
MNQGFDPIYRIAADGRETEAFGARRPGSDVESPKVAASPPDDHGLRCCP